MKKSILAPVLAALAASAAGAGADPLDVEGQWRTEDGDAIIEIAPCDGEAPCGTVVWIDPETVAVNADLNNPDPALRERPLVGIRTLWGLRRDDDAWTSGSVYDPEAGRTYRASVRRLNPAELEMKGCWGFICRTQTWTRVAEDAAE